MHESRDLPKWLWLYLPFAALVVQVAARLGGDETYKRWMRGEISVPELGTVLWLAIAVIAGVALLVRHQRLPHKWLVGWIAVFTLGCFFFGGEEASWGQSYFHWRTPEALAAMNKQNETGLHNFKGPLGILFDKAPRTGLTIAAIAIVVVVFWNSRRPEKFAPGTKLHWIWPTYVCVPAALLALTIGFPAKLFEFFGSPVPNVLQMQVGEFKEYFLGMMLMMYVLSLTVRLRAASAS